MPKPVSPPKPTGGPTEITFLNSTARGQRFCIIADNSGSMAGEALEYVKRELLSTLSSLNPESQFCVMFFNSTVEPMPFKGWLKGTRENVARVSPWIKTRGAGGGTEPQMAFVRALQLDPRPDVIFFMTDGLIPSNVPVVVAALNTGKPATVIHTIMFVSTVLQPASGLPQPRQGFLPPPTPLELIEAVRLLRQLANDSGGTYLLFTPATPEDLARAAETNDEKRLSGAISDIPRMGPGVRRVIPRLLTALRNSSDGARPLILSALRKVGPLGTAYLPALVSLLEDPSDEVQLFALRALSSQGSRARGAITPMTKLFARSDRPTVLLAVLDALARIAGADGSLTELYRTRGLTNPSSAVRLASLAALNKIGREALPFPLLAELAFRDSDPNVQKQAQLILAQRMKAATEKDLPEIHTLLEMKQQSEAVRLGLLGVAQLGTKARGTLPNVLNAFNGTDARLHEASVPALRAFGPEARETVALLMARLSQGPPPKQVESALLLAAIAPTSPEVVEAITPILVQNLHPANHPGRQAPPDVLLQSIKATGKPTVPGIFRALAEVAGERGAVAANHRKFLFLALAQLGPAAYSEENLAKVRPFTSPKAELYPDVRTAAIMATQAMTP